MTRAIDPAVAAEVLTAQRQAADPSTSAWVAANAGSGKTHVLTHRVLRLLLAGARPEDVLCLTYTKAAAAEMRQRIAAQLGRWALAEGEALRNSISGITGNVATSTELRRARTLFAHALDTPGGLRIQTIHAFCEALLHRFPVEAGVPFDFTVLEDHQRNLMIQRAQEAVLAGGLDGSDEAAAVETLVGALSDHVIGESIAEALAQIRPLRRVLADKVGAKARLALLAGDPGRPAAAIREAIETQSLLAPGDCREVVRLLNGNANKTRGVGFADKLAGANLDRPGCADLIDAFLVEKEEMLSVRGTLLAAAVRRLHPDLHARLEAEQARILELAQQLKCADLIERSNALLDILDAIITRYDAEKRARSLLDFDDLIAHAAALLRDPALGAWVRYKLDGRLSHILVDESQDTNNEQWTVVRLLADEFFAGEGAVERPRSIFAVGDSKQSIYSFQGADPELFAAFGDDFSVRAIGARMRFARVPLTTSFRTLPGVLEAVDRVFADPARRAAVLADTDVAHRTARAERGGTVTLWPPLQNEAATKTDEWPPQPRTDAIQSGARRVANRIAAEIRRWVDERRPLGSRGRPVRPEDVLILVQTRNALFHEVIRALHAARLPTPGADRLFVTGHIAVRDLMALGDVLLNTSDDLQLAALLRSPLFELGEDELFAVAHGRRGSLWAALRDSTVPAARAASETVRRWRRALDFERPYEFYADILFAEGGLRRFHTRFGPEVDDLFSEFLDLALEHEHAPNPSLQGFLAEMRSREVTIARELATATEGVRVMTVHGAKGLESPIVIIADAAAKPTGRQLVKSVLIDDVGGLLVHASGKKTHVPGTMPLYQAAAEKQQREYWRKLYVAMTRAEDELYVTGALGANGDQIKDTWYEAIESVLAPFGSEIRDAAGEVVGYVFSPQGVPAAVAAGGGGQRAEAAAAKAGPLQLRLPPHRVVPIVRPSMAAPDDAPEAALETSVEAVARSARDPEAARREGIALHALLQHLGRFAPAERSSVAARALEALLPEAPSRHAALVQKAVSILGRPELAPVFGPNSRAEVPFLVRAVRGGEAVKLVGRLDRLVVEERSVLVVDFKSDANPPDESQPLPAGYLAQVGLYAFSAGQLFPGYDVRAAILWTALESMVELPREALAKAASGFTMQ